MTSAKGDGEYFAIKKRKIRYAFIILARFRQCRLDWRRRSWPPARHCGCGSIASPITEIA
jgi:hypothetical protein